ncbi:CPBP family intramembrane metalloprotease [Pontibacter diazotrophicus]|uniref:CPBP family intramembrane metalloprotease n=1 Tax=Pontibacter diazotrophicus TaxID=1400979 RepID=A0A3D8LH24_9BACT|nr:CPBP family intramembrane glutamic endopeptidase [Pontibacter diazotrophicus]RDV16733.1 CPBP family intramembrane metalloprotease [Pontibacter diazotrophicus]
MLGNVVILFAFWGLLRLEHKSLAVLGLSPSLLRVLQLLLGFLATLCLAVTLSYLLSFIANFSWEPVPDTGRGFLFEGLYSTFQSVLFEELLFRGYFLYKAITLMGEKKANLVSAAAFGVYHWFTFGVLGNPVVMIWVFVSTGLWGLMFAYAYSRTGSLAFPIGLHWGWNFIDQIIFNKQGGSLFSAVTSVHTRYLSNLESMFYLQLPVLAFAVFLIVLLMQQTRPVKFSRHS